MENLSFDFFENDSIEEAKKLTVVELDFINNYQTNWSELFKGYSNLYAITFSSQLSFIEKVIRTFDYAEIIFGNESVMSSDIASALSYQQEVIQQISDSKPSIRKKIIDRISDGTLKLLVAKEKLSHEKIYLLTDGADNFKVLTGSANLSYAAFSGYQSETINELKTETAFNFYFERFQVLRDQSTNKIDEKNIIKFRTNIMDNIENLPIANDSKDRNAYEVLTISNNQEELLTYSVLKNKLELKKYMSDEKTVKSSINNFISKIKQKYESVNSIKNGVPDKKLPELEIDYNNRNIYLTGRKLDLNPNDEDISKDISCFFEFMRGYEKFNGTKEDIFDAQSRYYSFANWFFISPFLSHLRLLSHKNNKKPDPYPVFGLLYGNSKAGKTSFLSTLLYFMIKSNPLMPASDFKAKAINDIRYNTKGVPIIFDDMVANRFTQHAGEAIKNDLYGFNDGLNNYPAIIISANEDVKVVTQDIARRIVTCRVSIGLDTTEAMKNNSIRRIQKNISTAFYRKYLGLVLEKLDEFTAPLFDESTDNLVDAFKFSSEILLQLFEKYSKEPVPNYVKTFSIDDYFSERITSTYAIKAITDAYRYNPRSFTVDKKSNKLQYRNADIFELNRIKKELPDSLQSKVTQNILIMDFEKAKSFFDIDFKNRFLKF